MALALLSEVERAIIYTSRVMKNRELENKAKRSLWIYGDREINLKAVIKMMNGNFENILFFRSHTEIIHNLSKKRHEEKIEKLILLLSDIPQTEVVKYFGNYEVIIPDYKEMFQKVNKPVIGIATATKGAGKSALTLTVYKLLLNKNLNVSVATFPEINEKWNGEMYEIINSETDLEKSTLLYEKEEILPYIKMGGKVFVGFDYSPLNNNNSDIVLWGICKGSTEPPLIKPDLYITVVDLRRELWDFISYPGIFNLKMADIIVINKLNISRNYLKEKYITNEIKEINPEAEIIFTRETQIDVDTNIVIEERHKKLEKLIENVIYTRIKEIV